jgi:GTP-binding protein HflX
VGENVLRSLNSDLSRRLVLLNKYARVPDGRRLPETDAEQLPISALTGAGLAGLLSRIEEMLAQDVRTVSVVIPYAMGGLLSELYEKARVLSQQYLDDGVAVEAEVNRELYRRIADQLETVRENPRNAAR